MKTVCDLMKDRNPVSAGSTLSTEFKVFMFSFHVFKIQTTRFSGNGPKQTSFLCVETRNLDQCVLFQSA